MPPTVSVIIPMFDCGAYIREAIGSLQAQTLEEWEAIVIDDGSRDDGPAIVEGLARHDGRVRLLRQANAGVSAARNAGLDQARGEFVSFLDADDWLTPRGLEALVGRVRAGAGSDRSARVDAAVGSFAVCSPTGEELMTHASGLAEIGLDDLLEAYHYVHTISHIVRRSALDKAVPAATPAGGRQGGVCRGRFAAGHYGYEDLDLWLRLAEGGVRWGVTPELVARHRIRPGSISKDPANSIADSQSVFAECDARLAAQGGPVEGRRDRAAVVARLERRKADLAFTYVTRWAVMNGAASDGSRDAPGTAPPWVDRAAELYRRGTAGLPADLVRLAPALAANRGWTQVIYGVGQRPIMHRGQTPGWAVGLQRWWARCEVEGWLPAGGAVSAAADLRRACVDPARVTQRLLDHASAAAQPPGAAQPLVVVVGYGQNGRRVVEAAIARGWRVQVRDDRFDRAARPQLPAGATGALMGDPLPAGAAVIVTPIADAVLTARFPAAQTWNRACESEAG